MYISKILFWVSRPGYLLFLSITEFWNCFHAEDDDGDKDDKDWPDG